VPTIPAELDDLLAAQEELVTTAQARAAGVHGGGLARLVDVAALEPIAPRLYGRAGVPATWRRTMVGALLRAGPHAAASHRSCARLLRIPTYEAAAAEITVASKRGFAHPGVVVHQSRDLARVPLHDVDGIRCTPPLRLAVDIGAVLGPRAHATVIRELRRSHGATWRQLAAVLRLHSRKGRDGCGLLRAHLERYSGMDGIPDSTLEQLLLDHLIDAAFPLPTCQHEVPSGGERPYRIDFAYPDVLLAIEIDGPHHRLPEVMARDRRRDAHLESLGWRVIRIPEEVLTYTPEVVLRRIRDELRARGGWVRA